MEHLRLTMGDYRILHQLGSGSYGSVHLALHTPTDTKRVIKKIKISHMTPKEVEEARQEVQVLSSLSHQYITQFRSSCEEDGYLLIAMDYCGGGDLHSLITKRSGVLFPEDRVLDWFVQLCLAIKYIHDRKILHRDIKSQNIFLTDDGKVRLGDFGIAKILNSSSELAKTCIGTPYYLSPEMCENKPYNNKSDIWALGCVLYEMLSLRHAFEANNMKALILKITKGIYPPVASRYSRDLHSLLSQIFRREPQARPSISAILRKTFILKRVSRFISGCEEEELKASLVRRKCYVPASARKIPITRRPPDITEPSAKYGVSLNKKVTHKSPVKSAARLTKHANPNGKTAPKAHPRKTEKPSQEHRKKCPSDDTILSNNVHKVELESNGEKRYQRRSRSVPHVFKQNNLKPPQHQYSRKKPPSPNKLKLMLDSAGLRRDDKSGKRYENVHMVKSREDWEQSHQSPGATGWLVDEFLTKKLHSEYKKRKLVESLMLAKTSSSKSIEYPNAVARGVSPVYGSVAKNSGVTQGGASVITKPCTYASPVLDRLEQHQVCKPDSIHIMQPQCVNPGDADIQNTNEKDVKELANQSLKQQNEHYSDDENEKEGLLEVSSEQLRQKMQKKMKKLLEERTHKMSQMVAQRRQWAYEREKLGSSQHKTPPTGDSDFQSATYGSKDTGHIAHLTCDKATVLSDTVSKKQRTKYEYENFQIGQKNDSQFHDVDNAGIRSEESHDEESTIQQNESEEIMNSTIQEKMTKETRHQEKQNFAQHVQCDQSSVEKPVGHDEGKSSNVQSLVPENSKCISEVSHQEGKNKVNIARNICVNEFLKMQGSQNTADKPCSEPTTSEGSVLSQNITPSHRARWGAVRTADLEKSPLETTASEMDSTTSSDCVVVYKETGERKQWKKDCSDILNVLSEAQIVEEKRKSICKTGKAKSLRNVETVSQNKPSASGQANKPAVMNSTFTLTEGLKDCQRDSCSCNMHMSGNMMKDDFNYSTEETTLLGSSFQIDKLDFDEDRKSIGPPLLNSTFDIDSKPCPDKLCEVSLTAAHDCTYEIYKQDLVTDDLHKPSDEKSSECAENLKTVVLKDKKNMACNKKPDNQNVGVASAASSDELTARQEDTETVSSVMSIFGRDTVTQEQTTDGCDAPRQARGGLLEKLRTHIKPRPKKKYQRLTGSPIKLPRSPLASESKLNMIIVDSILDTPKGTNTSERKRGSLKLGLSGILRKLSSRSGTKTPERSRSVEKDDNSCFEEADKAFSDTESLGRTYLVEAGTLNSKNIVDNGRTHEEIGKTTDDGRTQGSCSSCKVLETYLTESSKQGNSGRVNLPSTKYSMDSNSDLIKQETYDKVRPDSSYAIHKKTDLETVEEKKSTLLPSKSDFLPVVNFDEMFVDSGIDTQNTFTCQTSGSIGCNSQTSLFMEVEPVHSSLKKQLNEIGCFESKNMDMTTDSSEYRHNWFDNSLTQEEANSTVHVNKSRTRFPQHTCGKNPNVEKFASSLIKEGFEMAKSIMLESSFKEKVPDVSPVSTSGILINLKSCIKQSNSDLSFQCQNELICKLDPQQAWQIESSAASNSEPSKVLEDLQATQIRIAPSDKVHDQLHKQNYLKSSIEQPTKQHSPARARPTVLNIGAKIACPTEMLQVSSTRSTKGKMKCIGTKHSALQQTLHTCKESQECLDKDTKNGSEALADVNNLEPASSCKITMPHKIEEVLSSSDEESEDLASLRQSMELLLSSGEHKREEKSKKLSEVWHVDKDGMVVPGGGGVYGWIEEQRARLEDTLGLSLFMKAYHLLDAAQEQKGCMVGESVTQVEHMLGQQNQHLAYDILQLVVAEAVYHN